MGISFHSTESRAQKLDWQLKYSSFHLQFDMKLSSREVRLLSVSITCEIYEHLFSVVSTRWLYMRKQFLWSKSSWSLLSSWKNSDNVFRDHQSKRVMPCTTVRFDFGCKTFWLFKSTSMQTFLVWDDCEKSQTNFQTVVHKRANQLLLRQIEAMQSKSSFWKVYVSRSNFWSRENTPA